METKDQKKEDFVKKTQEHRQKQSEELVYQLLASMLATDIPVFSSHYVINRSAEVLQNAIHKTTFENKKIKKLRLELLKESILAVKANLVFLEEKKSYEDDTEERNQKCEPVVKRLMDLVLNEELFMSDADYLNEAITEDDKLLLSFISKGYIDSIYNMLISVIDEHLRRANKNKWGVDKEGITFSMLDSSLKEI